MERKKSTIALVTIVVVLAVVYILYAYSKESGTETHTNIDVLPDSPLFATYVHRDSSITLENGTFAEDGVRIEAVSDPAYGDIDGDANNDAVLLLAETEERVTHYYIALALADDMGFLGMDTVPLSEDKTPTHVSVTDEMVQVFYEGDTEYKNQADTFVLTGVRLERHKGEGDIVSGEYVMEGDTQTFQPCNADQLYQIATDSHSLPALKAIYTERTYNRPTLSGVYVVLSGAVAQPSSEGAEPTFTVNSIVRVPEAGGCKTELETDVAPEVEE